MLSEMFYSLFGYAQQPILWAMAEVIFRLGFLLANPSLFAIENFLFCAFLCGPSIFLAYALINGGQFRMAFIWPLANAVLWAIDCHTVLCITLCMPHLLPDTVDRSQDHLFLLFLLGKAIFFLGYALVIAKYWKELSQRIGQLEKDAIEEGHGQVQPEMKIQLQTETWFDILEFVPRSQLGKIVPQIGNSKFARIAQPFLHNYGRITLGNIWLYRPGSFYFAARLQELLPQCSYITCSRLLPADDVPMPENATDFLSLHIRHLDTSVLNFLRKFHQNSLFENVNLNVHLELDFGLTMNTLQTTLSYVLPLIKNTINSIQLGCIAQLGAFYNANSDMVMDMLEMPRILGIRSENRLFKPEKTSLLERWLYTPRDDGKPRVMILPNDAMLHHSNILHLIDNIKMDFSTCKRPGCFFVRLFVLDNYEWHHDTCMENRETKEKLVVKKMALSDKQKRAIRQAYPMEQKVALISRYPLNVVKHWVEANEREALDWDFDEQNRQIHVDNPMINTIPRSFEHSSEGREAHYRNIRLCDCFSSANNGPAEDQGGNRDDWDSDNGGWW